MILMHRVRGWRGAPRVQVFLLTQINVVDDCGSSTAAFCYLLLYIGHVGERVKDRKWGCIENRKCCVLSCSCGLRTPLMSWSFSDLGNIGNSALWSFENCFSQEGSLVQCATMGASLLLSMAIQSASLDPQNLNVDPGLNLNLSFWSKIHIFGLKLWCIVLIWFLIVLRIPWLCF